MITSGGGAAGGVALRTIQALGFAALLGCGVELTSAQNSSPVLVGAGDIASCEPDQAEATAKLLDKIGGTVFTAGDNAYPNGSDAQFKCYDRSWGRHRQRTRPSPGNHDYETSRAAGYFKYFGANAGPAGRGFYNYRLGPWQIYSLNSNANANTWGIAQEQWLIRELRDNSADCTLAYWHHPLFSSSTTHGGQAHMRRLFKILHTNGADVVIVGHDHTYERFAPQNAEGRADPKGTRQFVVGTGGVRLYKFGAVRPHSEARNSDDHGVLKLTLHPLSYDWEFIPIAGGKFRDSGSAECSTHLAVGRR